MLPKGIRTQILIVHSQILYRLLYRDLSCTIDWTYLNDFKLSNETIKFKYGVNYLENIFIW